MVILTFAIPRVKTFGQAKTPAMTKESVFVFIFIRFFPEHTNSMPNFPFLAFVEDEPEILLRHKTGKHATVNKDDVPKSELLEHVVSQLEA